MTSLQENIITNITHEFHVYKQINNLNVQSKLCKGCITQVIKYLNLTKNQPSLNIYGFTGIASEVKTRPIISTSSTKQQTIIDFITADYNTPFGVHCETKCKGIIRIIQQNTNELDLGSDALTTRELIYNDTKGEVDAC